MKLTCLPLGKYGVRYCSYDPGIYSYRGVTLTVAMVAMDGAALISSKQIWCFAPQTSEENGGYPARPIHMRFLWKELSETT